MAKYHWERITADPELNRELMITLNVEDEDEDALWPQLPDVCREGALPFMHASCVISLMHAPSHRGIWGIIGLCGKYLYEGDAGNGDDAGPFDDLSDALNCISGPTRVSSEPADFEVMAEGEPSAQILGALAKHLIEGDRVRINTEPHVLTRGEFVKAYTSP
jgi:hypothetical protein